jgi:hypothetical protein
MNIYKLCSAGRNLLEVAFPHKAISWFFSVLCQFEFVKPTSQKGKKNSF